MKKFIFIAILLCLVNATSAQFEANGGVTVSRQKSNYSNYNSKYRPPQWWIELWKFAKWITGNKVNSGDDSPYAALSTQNLSWGAGIGLGSKGAKFNYTGGSSTTSIFYVQLQALARYDFELNDQLGIYTALGPYYAVALGGKYKDEAGKIDLNFGTGDDDDFRRGDYGFKFRAGVRLKNKPITIGLHGDFGLRNITPDGDDDFKIKNQTFGLQVGYVFDSFR